jgi:hypothetical protein
MRKISIIILLVIGFTSCQKEDYVYNHCYTFDKTKFGVASSTFFVSHELSEQEKKDWCYTMDLKVIENYKKKNPSITIEDLDTSYVYMVEHLK